jgi:uncharacterized protein (TIGR02001 family)
MAGTIKNGIVGLALLTGFSAPAFAADIYTPAAAAAPVEAAAPTHKLGLSANVALTTDYIFRGISQTAENPAIQGGFDLTYNIFYAGVWSSNLDFGGGPFGQDIASIEIDYYAGIRPTWGKWTFDVGGYAYTYPGSCESKCGLGELDYFELKTGVSRTFFDKLSLSLANWWSPDNSGGIGQNDVLEFGAGWAFNKWWIFTPTVSGLVGHQWAEQSEGGVDYTYWNAGLSLGFAEKFTADIRYWDTDNSTCQNTGVFSCDERVVGTLKAVF